MGGLEVQDAKPLLGGHPTQRVKAQDDVLRKLQMPHAQLATDGSPKCIISHLSIHPPCFFRHAQYLARAKAWLGTPAVVLCGVP